MGRWGCRINWFYWGADADGDGTGDGADACPADAAKIEAGLCGCGVAETPGCGDVPRCESGLAIGISLDSSGSIGSDSFAVALQQARPPPQPCPGPQPVLHTCVT